MLSVITEFVPEFKTGELIVIRVTGKTYSDDGWAMGGFHGDNIDSLKIYSRIDLGNFPSSNDFFGESTIVSDGQVAIVVKAIGRPTGLSHRVPHSPYDIYEIMLDGVTRHIFRNNIEKILSPKNLDKNND